MELYKIFVTNFFRFAYFQRFIQGINKLFIVKKYFFV